MGEISGGSGAGSTRGNVNVKAGTVDVAAAVVEMVSTGNFDITGLTTTIDATTLILAGKTIEVEDKANNKKYDLIKFLAGNRRSLAETNRRLDAMEEKSKTQEDDDSPSTEELSAQIQELWQMLQKHYVQLMKDSKAADKKSQE